MELTKKQIATIKAVGKACDTKSERIIKSFVFSDGRDVFATNAYIALYEREVGLPKGAYFPQTGLSADEEIRINGFEVDDFLGSFKRLEANVSQKSEQRRFMLGAKTLFFRRERKFIYELTFSAEEDQKNYVLKRLFDKAEKFLGRNFVVFQNAPDEPVVFERDDGKRIAIIMPYYTAADTCGEL